MNGDENEDKRSLQSWWMTEMIEMALVQLDMAPRRGSGLGVDSDVCWCSWSGVSGAHTMVSTGHHSLAIADSLTLYLAVNGPKVRGWRSVGRYPGSCRLLLEREGMVLYSRSAIERDTVYRRYTYVTRKYRSCSGTNERKLERIGLTLRSPNGPRL